MVTTADALSLGELDELERLDSESLDRVRLTELAEGLMHASHADASGWMAGTKGAADRHDFARAAFTSAVRAVRVGELADALLELRSLRRCVPRLVAAARRGEAAEREIAEAKVAMRELRGAVNAARRAARSTTPPEAPREMSDQTPVDKSSPLWLAWVAYRGTEEYANTKHWTANPANVDGSLWAAFVQGFSAASAEARKYP